MLLPRHRVDLRGRRAQTLLHPTVGRLLQRIAHRDQLRVRQVRAAQDDAVRPTVGVEAVRNRQIATLTQCIFWDTLRL